MVNAALCSAWMRTIPRYSNTRSTGRSVRAPRPPRSTSFAVSRHRCFPAHRATAPLLYRDWARYDTRDTVFEPARVTPEQLEGGYWRAYHDFYTRGNIGR